MLHRNRSLMTPVSLTPKALLAATLFAFFGVAGAHAQATLFPKIVVRAGGFALGNDTKIRLDGGVQGTEVDFESDFGVESSVTLAKVGIEWLPAKRHQFRLGYYESGRSGRRTLIDRQIVWGGDVYPIGAEVSSDFRNRVFEVDWTWWLMKRQQAGLGVTLGATVLDLRAAADARVQAGSNVQHFHHDASATAPVPTVGVEGRAEIRPRLFVQGYARFLPKVHIQDISGSALQYSGTLEWMPFDHVGVGVGWHAFEVNADVDDTSFRGVLDLQTRGWLTYARFAW